MRSQASPRGPHLAHDRPANRSTATHRPRLWRENEQHSRRPARHWATVQTVGSWRERFREDGLGALDNPPRTGAARRITGKKVESVVTLTLEIRTWTEANSLNQNAMRPRRIESSTRD